MLSAWLAALAIAAVCCAGGLAIWAALRLLGGASEIRLTAGPARGDPEKARTGTVQPAFY